MNILRISSPGQTVDIKEQWWVHSHPICAFILGLVSFDGWWWVYKVGSISGGLARKCFEGKLFHWYVVWLVAQGFFATGLYGWRVAWLVVWLIWSHVTFQFSFQSIITTYHFNWHISAFKPRFHTRPLVDRLLANMMAPVRQDLQTKVTDAFVHLNTRAPIARKETVGKNGIFHSVKYFYEKLYLTL